MIPDTALNNMGVICRFTEISLSNKKTKRIEKDYTENIPNPNRMIATAIIKDINFFVSNRVSFSLLVTVSSTEV